MCVGVRSPGVGAGPVPSSLPGGTRGGGGWCLATQLGGGICSSRRGRAEGRLQLPTYPLVGFGAEAVERDLAGHVGDAGDVGIVPL